MRIVVGGLDGFLSGLAWNTLTLHSFILFSCKFCTWAGIGTASGTAGNVGWVASAGSGTLNWSFGGSNWGSRCGSGSWSSDWLFNYKFLFWLEKLGLFVLLLLL